MTKILMVTTLFPPHFSGAAVQAVTLAKALREKGYQIEFLTNNLNGKTVVDHFDGFKIHRLKTFKSFGSKCSEVLFAWKTFVYAIIRRDIQIVHFHSVQGLGVVIFPILRLFGKKIILKLTLMGSDDPLSFKQRKKLGWLYFWGLQFVSRFIAISPGLINMAIKAGISKDNILLIDNGLNIEKFYPADRDEKMRIREALGLKDFNKIFISIGQVEARKGYDFLLQAWEKISKSVDNAILLIAGPNNDGSNPFYCELIRFLQEHNLNNVRFLGKIENASDYLRASDCFLFCSKSEGFGTVMVEAMATEVPVVALKIDGVTEFILQNRDISDICSSLDPEDFAIRTLKTLQIDKERLKKASIKIQTKYSIDTIAKQYDELYKQLLSRA